MVKIGNFLRYYKSTIIALIILSLSIVSTDEIAPHSILIIPNADKYVHFLMYGGLSFILLIEFNRKFFSIYPGLVVPLFVSILYGGFIEMVQILIPYRSADIIDFLFDIGGSLFGLLLFFLWRKIRY